VPNARLRPNFQTHASTLKPISRKVFMSLTTAETLELELNRLIYAAEQISRSFVKADELSDTLNIGYPFTQSFEEVLNALVQWRDSACNKQTQLLPDRITLKESNLEHAARNVLKNWEAGDLAGAIIQLSNALPDQPLATLPIL
jgi:hypothetical protein